QCQCPARSRCPESARHRAVWRRARRLRQIRNRRPAATSTTVAHLRGCGRDEADRPRCGSAAAEGVGRRRRPPRQDERGGRGRPGRRAGAGQRMTSTASLSTRAGGGGTGPAFGKFFLPGDRKSTRLNSSHEWISYAVFCLKKKI